MAIPSRILPGKSHGQRRLSGYHPWGCKELDTTEVTEHAHKHFAVHNSVSFFPIKRLIEETQVSL